MKSDREYRAFQVNAQDDEKRVTGYATTFDEPYTLYSDGDYEVREVIDPSAFDNCDMSDVIMMYNHEGRVFARLSNQRRIHEQDVHGFQGRQIRRCMDKTGNRGQDHRRKTRHVCGQTVRCIRS